MSLGEYLKKNLFPVAVFLYSLCVSLFWTALRINYAGISKFLGADKNQGFFVMYLPVLVLILLWILTLYSLFALVRYQKRRIHTFVSLGFSILFTIAIGAVIYFGSLEYLPFILPHFYRSLAIAGVLLLFAAALFLPLKERPAARLIKAMVLVCLIIASVIAGYKWRPNRFVCEGAVYAVEDTYQIVFSTSDDSVGWVEIGGKPYYELYAGSMKSRSLVHKVTVPQSVLDQAGSYTICAQQLIYRGPFGGYKGDIITLQHAFRPVDLSDGLSYYAISDVHENFDAAYTAASCHQDMDLLVVLGDIVSMVEWEKDAIATSVLINRITGGSIPAVYARGNHEIKGQLSEDFHQYVASKGEDFFYTFSLGGVKGIVLDLGEDHDDDWWEYYGTARFDLYRDRQTEFLEQCLEEGFLEDAQYRMVLCHIPLPFVNSRHNHETYKNEWTELINEMNVDIVLSGHQHDLTIFEPGKIEPHTVLTYNPRFSGTQGKTYKGYLTDFEFYSFLAARASNKQTGDTVWLGKHDQYTGLWTTADFKKKVQDVRYTNAAGKTIDVCNIFTDEEPVTSYRIPLH